MALAPATAVHRSSLKYLDGRRGSTRSGTSGGFTAGNRNGRCSPAAGCEALGDVHLRERRTIRPEPRDRARHLFRCCEEPSRKFVACSVRTTDPEDIGPTLASNLHEVDRPEGRRLPWKVCWQVRLSIARSPRVEEAIVDGPGWSELVNYYVPTVVPDEKDIGRTSSAGDCTTEVLVLEGGTIASHGQGIVSQLWGRRTRRTALEARGTGRRGGATSRSPAAPASGAPSAVAFG